MKPVILFRILILFAVFAGTGSFAQMPSSGTDAYHDRDGNTWHQLNLDFQADELIELQYMNSSEPVDGILGPDGTTVLIRNYLGDRAVKAIVRKAGGETQEVVRSKCSIDAVMLAL